MRRTELRIRLWQQIADSLSVLYGDREEWDLLIARYNNLSLTMARTEHMEVRARGLARKGNIPEALGMHSFLGTRQWESVKRLLIIAVRDQHTRAEAEMLVSSINLAVQQIERMDGWPEMDRAIEHLLRKNDEESLRQATELAALGCAESTLKLVFDHLRKPLADRAPNMTPAPPVHSSLDDDMDGELTEDTVTDLSSPALKKRKSKTRTDEPMELDDSCIAVFDEASEDTGEEDPDQELEATDNFEDPFPEGSTTQ